jgi:hypothetical protein
VGTTGEGVFHSTNNGASWSAVDTGLTNTDIYGLAVIGTNIFAGTFQSPGDSIGGVFVSTNDGSGTFSEMYKMMIPQKLAPGRICRLLP